MSARQRVGAVLVVAGVALALVGIASLLLSPAAPPVALASPTPNASLYLVTAVPATSAPSTPPTQAPATLAPTDVADALVRAFFVRLQAAIRNGTQQTNSGLLAEAVTDRYSFEVCNAFLISRDPVPEQVFEILAVHDPAPWDYVTDGRTTTIPDAITVDARVTGSDANGVISTAERELHVQLVGVEVRWFSDCGTPLG